MRSPSSTEPVTEQYIQDVFGIWKGALTPAQLRVAKEAMRRALFQREPTPVEEDVVDVTFLAHREWIDLMLKKGFPFRGVVRLEQDRERWLLRFDREETES